MSWAWGFFAVLAVALVVAFYRVDRACRRAARTDWGGSFLNWLDGLNRLYCHHYHRLPEVDLELPDGGSAIVVSNHVSGLDPLLLIASCHRPLRFLIAREQYNRFGLHSLFKAVGCIPVDRSGRPEKAMRDAIRALRDGEVVALFPHGKIHLDSDPPRRLKGGGARLATATGTLIHPARIEDVAGHGHVLPAVFLRGHARLCVCAVIDPQHERPDALLEQIRVAIESPCPTG